MARRERPPRGCLRTNNWGSASTAAGCQRTSASGHDRRRTESLSTSALGKGFHHGGGVASLPRTRPGGERSSHARTQHHRGAAHPSLHACGRRAIPEPMRDRCLNCLSSTHRIATCRRPLKCLNCHGLKHLARDCPRRCPADRLTVESRPESVHAAGGSGPNGGRLMIM